MKKDKFIKILGFILDYLPIFITVFLAGITSIRTISSNITLEEMLQWILAILALMATTQLIERFRIIRNFDKKIDQISENLKENPGANNFFINHLPDLNHRLETAKSISISGISLVRTSAFLWSTFNSRLENGSKIKILIADPNDQAINIIATRFKKHQDPIRLKREIQHAMDNFKPLEEQYSSNGLFQIRLAQFSPPFGLWIIDPDSPTAEIWVEIYSFRDLPEPAFQLLPNRDGDWFNFFKHQFELMWDASREVYDKS